MTAVPAPVPAPSYVPGHKLLDGKGVVITAAAGTGIGFAAAKRCAEEGARIVISDIHERRLNEAADALAEAVGVRPPTVLCNVTREADVQNLVDVAARELGGIDVMINNASVVGWRAQDGQCHYAAAKAGVMALTRCAAMEAAAHNVRVNCVAPSLAMHPFLAKVSSQDFLDSLVSLEAFKRAAEPWEVANVMVFLASDYASYMTGEVVSVSAQHP